MTQQRLELADLTGLDFTALCQRVIEAYDTNRDALHGDIFAYLAKQLVAMEVTPGGPYRDEHGDISITLNATIGRLFLYMGHPLPNIESFLAPQTRASLTKTDRRALGAYMQTLEEKRPHVPSSRSTNHASYQRAVKTLSSLEEPVKTQLLTFLKRVEKADTTHEIAAIAQFTKEAVPGAHISSAKLSSLGEANVHTWIAYTIYDHILDGEADTSLLPAANVCMRRALHLYRQALPVTHPLQLLITEYFDRVDVASAWEVTSSRLAVGEGRIQIDSLPDYEDYHMLAWRSCIHILGPLIVATYSELSDEAVSRLAKGLHHYLIARQLGDDIHDWREDLAAGHVSAVVCTLLARQRITSGSSHDLRRLTRAIQQDFLNEGALEVSDSILAHTSQAIAELLAAGCGESSRLVGLVFRLKRMAEESAEHQQRFASFKQSYTTRLET